MVYKNVHDQFKENTMYVTQTETWKGICFRQLAYRIITNILVVP